jgi:hypothetical protein
MHRAGHSRILAFALVVTAASVLQGQVRPGSPPPSPPGQLSRPVGTIDGVVTDTSLVPLQAAFVSILGTKIRVGTGPNGRFRITRIPVGQYLVIVRRVGYRPTSAVVDVSELDTLRLAYALETVNSSTLETVVVTEKAPSQRMLEFESRRKLGMGEFMTAEEIAQRNSVYATELFRKFLTVNVSPSRTSSMTQYFALSRREGGNPSLGACPMQLYLDQVPLPSPFNLDLLPSPKEIAGIEVYAGAATIPLQYKGYDRGCGVILVWTKDGP